MQIGGRGSLLLGLNPRIVLKNVLRFVRCSPTSRKLRLIVHTISMIFFLDLLTIHSFSSLLIFFSALRLVGDRLVENIDTPYHTAQKHFFHIYVLFGRSFIKAAET